MRSGRKHGSSSQILAAAIAILASLGVPPASRAEGAPSACVAELRKAYGGGSGLASECAGETDCTFLAPPANATALALVGAIAKRARECFAASGLKLTKEDRNSAGTTGYYAAEGASERCALLLAVGASGAAEGVRATCQPAD
jgi:hypothetical protein